MESSEFERWFFNQHGPREQLPGEDEELRIAAEVGRIAEAELARRKLWDEKQQSALYAWQARDAGNE